VLFMTSMATFVQEGLRWWLDLDFARFSTPVLQILAIGVFISSLAPVFATLIQRVGRPDVTVALPIVELPIYLPMLWWVVQRFGIVGAAMVWMAFSWMRCCCSGFRGASAAGTASCSRALPLAS
jgi:O-antigen/teichoic acid export membrane protein